MCCKKFAESNKSADNLNAHLYGSFATENRREHGHSVLGKNQREVSPASPTLGRILRPQDFGFAPCQPKHQVGWEAGPSAPDLLIQSLCGHLVEFGEVGIHHDLLPSNQVDSPFNDDAGSRQFSSFLWDWSAHTT